jgi:hypothetical protein
MSKKLDIATREIPIREIPIRSQPSICQDTWRASQRPSAFQSSGFSKSIVTGPRNSRNRDTRNPDKISAVHFGRTRGGHRGHYRHSTFPLDRHIVSTEHRKSRYPEEASGPSISLGHVAQIRRLEKIPEEESAIGKSGFGKSRNLRTGDRVSFQ